MTATIALVDDDRNILTSVSIALQAEGFLTRVYSDGETALKALVGQEKFPGKRPPRMSVVRKGRGCSPSMERLEPLECF